MPPTPFITSFQFGKVYKGRWRDKDVAVKSMILPTNMNGSEKKERMAIMEAAISSSLSHPNIVQTFTYTLSPVREGSGMSTDRVTGSRASTRASPSGTLPSASASAFEVRIVLEYCDRGTLRDALSQRAFVLLNGSVNYLAVLETAADVARGMDHLHSQGILHADLKVESVNHVQIYIKPAGYIRNC